MAIENNDIETSTTTTIETEAVEKPAEKVFTQSQLEAILMRKEAKLKAELDNAQAKLREYESKWETEAKPVIEKSMTQEEKLKALDINYKNQLAKLESEKNEILNKQRTKQKEAELLKIASKTTRPELVAKLMKDKIKIDENDKVYAVNEYDLPITLDEALVEFLTQYPEFAPAPASGTGTKAGVSAAIAPKAKPEFKNSYEYSQYVASLLASK